MACCCNRLPLNSYNTEISVAVCIPVFCHFFNFYYYSFLSQEEWCYNLGAAWGARRQREAWMFVSASLSLSPVVQSLLRESQVIRQTKEKQISELKKMSDQSAESLKNEWEKKVRKGWKGSGFHRPVPPLNTEHSVSFRDQPIPSESQKESQKSIFFWVLSGCGCLLQR